jgi:hypothetical protein
MGFLKILWQVEWRALVVLAICAAIVGAIGFVNASTGPPPIGGSPLDWAWLGAGYTLTIGALPVAAWGAPVYAAFAYRSKSSITAAFVIGVIPGLVVLWFERKADGLASWLIACGAVVAIVTHMWFNRSRAQPPSSQP